MRVRKILDQLAQPFRHAWFRPDAIQVRVGFEDVQMVVHGLLFVHVLFAQPRVRACLRPVATADFEITAKLSVVRMTLDQSKQFLRPIQCRRIAEREMKFRQRINIKRLAVDFFGVIDHPARVIQPPERAAMLRVPKLIHHEIERAFRHFRVNRLRPDAMDGGKCPQDPRCSRSSLSAVSGRA